MSAPTTTASTAHDLRISISAEIEAMKVFEADAQAHHKTAQLAALQAREADLWDALGNVAALP